MTIGWRGQVGTIDVPSLIFSVSRAARAKTVSESPPPPPEVSQTASIPAASACLIESRPSRTVRAWRVTPIIEASFPVPAKPGTLEAERRDNGQAPFGLGP